MRDFNAPSKEGLTQERTELLEMVRCQETNPRGRSHYRLHKGRGSEARAPSSLGLIRCSQLHLQVSAAQRKPPPSVSFCSMVRLETRNGCQTVSEIYASTTEDNERETTTFSVGWLIDDDRHSRRQKTGPGWLRATALGKVLWPWLPQPHQIFLNRRTITSPHGCGHTSCGTSNSVI
jgi:hypothetical protein